LKDYVQESGEECGMIADAIEEVPVQTLATALFTRFRSRQSECFVENMLAALRNAFGDHAVRR
jgi:6-phosphogluconate dehydrogenase